MTGRNDIHLPAARLDRPIGIVHAPSGDGLYRRCIGPKDLLNATFTLLHEYETGRYAVYAAAVGGPDDALEDFDAFTELRKPVWRCR